MVFRVMLPCDGYSPAWEWMNAWQHDTLRDWWGNSARLVRESVGAPDWADYVDRDGNAWSKVGLFADLVFKAIDVYEDAHVNASLADLDSVQMDAMLRGWIDARVFCGELVRLVGEGEA